MENKDDLKKRITDTMLLAVNERKLELFDEIMAERFTDHHPGMAARESSRQSYVGILKNCIENLQVKAELDIVFYTNEYTIVFGWMTGKHIGKFLGVSPTGNLIRWSYIEVYRIDNGKIVERWSLDDLPGLLKQMGVTLPAS